MPVIAGSIQQTEQAATPYTGIVSVATDRGQGTGTLLYDGRAVLTAAHILEGSGPLTQASAQFTTPEGSFRQAFEKYSIHPNYDAGNNNYDLALLWFDEPVSAAATRHSPYRLDNENRATVDILGYGVTGTGEDGYTVPSDGVRRLVENRLETDAATLKATLGDRMGWDPAPGEQLVADFDNGQAANDALGQLINQSGLGLGETEGLIAPGDSGGPALINDAIAGVASYTASLSTPTTRPDVNNTSDSSYGEIAGFQRVSSNQQWIDQSLRAEYPNAPQSPDEVSTTVVEGDSASTYAYFMLSFDGDRDTPDELLSVDYRTEDGTAEAGQDYIAAEGTLILYPGETEAVIPVEVLSDNLVEGNETFSLSVYNPVGGDFGEGVEELTATRTIIDDDGMMV
jgi:hypothetical protein